ncbi:MAG: glycosyltransferase [Planctomycetes bacterium]|nr:glycosyltransferase [Planctomycetota bacterium]
MTLHVAISGWLLGAPSGANRRLQELLRHIAPKLAADERITVLHRDEVRPFASLPQVGWRAVPIAAAPTLRRVRDERRVLPGVLRELGANVLDHGFLPLPRLPIPVTLTVHDLRAADGFSRWPRWLARNVVRDAAARAAAIAVPSGFTADRLRAIAPGTAPIVIPNGVALPPVAAAPPALPGYLLHVGHLEARKNLGVLVRALGLLPADERPELRLVGADAGSLRGLRELARATGVAGLLTHCGTIDDTALAAQFAAARAVVMPSRYEGFGLPALEGLAPRPTGAGRRCRRAARGRRRRGQRAACRRRRCLGARDRGDCRGGAGAARRLQAARYDWSSAATLQLQLWRRVAELVG